MTNGASNGNLQGFLDRTRMLLKWIVDNRDPLLVPEAREVALAAWPEIDVALNRLAERVDSLDLQEVGLASGPQLNFKLTAFDLLWDKFVQWGWKKWLKKLLDLINSILGSLGIVTSLADLVKEFKDTLEAALDEEIDDDAELASTQDLEVL